MYWSKQIGFSIFLLTLVGCSASKNIAQRNVFTFQISDTTYQITSLNSPTGEGFNILEQAESNLTARDINQDGELDLVLKGNKSLLEANEIYQTGIKIAQETGNIKERYSTRKFEWENESYKYALSTYVFSQGKSSNVFVIGDKSLLVEYLFTDIDADGTLDSIEKGTISLEEAQNHYLIVLEQGIKENLIQHKEGQFIVLENHLRPIYSSR
ncbi:MAG: hypothetical protein MI700_06440 [Balneolales bacterium]|nr:hypothetical protein [Balneolales bacterium]